MIFHTRAKYVFGYIGEKILSDNNGTVKILKLTGFLANISQFHLLYNPPNWEM